MSPHHRLISRTAAVRWARWQLQQLVPASEACSAMRGVGVAMGATMLLVVTVILSCWLLLKLLVSADMLARILSYVLPIAIVGVLVIGTAGGEWLYQRRQANSRYGWWRCGVAGWFWSMLTFLLYYMSIAGPAALGVVLVVFCTYMIPMHGIVLSITMAAALLVRLVTYLKIHVQRTGT